MEYAYNQALIFINVFAKQALMALTVRIRLMCVKIYHVKMVAHVFPHLELITAYVSQALLD